MFLEYRPPFAASSAVLIAIPGRVAYCIYKRSEEER
jgi:hypothetical protein